MAVSPLAPESFPVMAPVAGVRFASAEAHVRYPNRRDVMLVHLAPGTAVAGVFTTSATRSAPVRDCEDKLGGDASSGAAILVNSGNSNAFTGRAGEEAVAGLTARVAEVLDLPATRVFTASTGVIGEPLPYERIAAKLPDLAAALTEDGIEGAARAIMTTDTFPKAAMAEVEVDGGQVRIAGIAKGSGMIAPDMATMLVYLFTDALIAQPDLQALVKAQCDLTFNCITVDSDTSTSDTLIMAATGASGIDVTDSVAFNDALHAVMLDLAHQVVRDGEGATKFVEVRVSGAATDADARRVARAIADSPLVKTAVAGEDPNWGRIVMAVGKSGARADRDRLSIRLGDILVAENGFRAPGYTEEQGADYMKRQEIVIAVNLGLAGGMATMWTCDLTHGYISINADYRT